MYKRQVLPSLVSCTTVDGSKLDKEVVWDSANVELEAYKTVTVTGTVADDGYKVTATVEVVPQDLKYFISAGTGTGYTDNKTKVAVSEPYNACLLYTSVSSFAFQTVHVAVTRTESAVAHSLQSELTGR